MPDPKKSHEQKIRTLFSTLATSDLGHYLKIGGFSLLGLLAINIHGWIKRGWVFPDHTTITESVMIFPASYLFTLPFSFLLLIRALNRQEKIQTRFSLGVLIASLVLFIIGFNINAKKHDDIAAIFLATSIVLGLFIMVPFLAFCHRVRSSPVLGAVAAFGSCVSCLYNLFDTFLFERLCQSTAFVVYCMLHSIGFQIGVNVSDGENVRLFSRYYMLAVYRPCSGIEGIFMFQFLLSAILMFDWPIFRRMHLIEMYLVGFLYMFLVNCLRIASLFTIAYFASMPDASEAMQEWRGAPKQMFHSFAGQIYYFIAFTVFAMIVYKRAIRAAAKARAVRQ